MSKIQEVKKPARRSEREDYAVPDDEAQTRQDVAVQSGKKVSAESKDVIDLIDDVLKELQAEEAILNFRQRGGE